MKIKNWHAGALAAAVLLGGSIVGVSQASAEETPPTIPTTPSVATDMGKIIDGVRSFDLTAAPVTQQISNFPIKTATVWGFNGGTPGPTLVAYEGEQIKITLHNELPPGNPTTIHTHGLHQPNQFDGVAGISQPDPIPVGGSFTYGPETPLHAGTFSYHSHTDGAVQDLRGLEGLILILPKKEPANQRVDVDVAMTLQQFFPPSEGALVDPFPPGTGSFAFHTINGKTGDAAGAPIEIKKGDKVRIRIYNGSQQTHSMHLHGHDEVLVSKNGHPVPRNALTEETTQPITPGDFFEIEFRADNPGNWIFHCHFPHHTTNKMLAGYNGAPVGMLRIFHYQGYAPVPPGYFAYSGKDGA